MTESGTFLYGLTNKEGLVCKDFTLSERNFGHSLQLANDPSIDREKFVDPAYYDAAIISKRLAVAGIPALSSEMILNLDGDDGDILTNSMIALDQRRAEFRSALQAPAETAACPA